MVTRCHHRRALDHPGCILDDRLAVLGAFDGLRKLDLGTGELGQKGDRTEWAGRCFSAVQFEHSANRLHIALVRLEPQPNAVDVLVFLIIDGDPLRDRPSFSLGSSKPSIQDHDGQDQREKDQQSPFEELDVGRADHAGRHDNHHHNRADKHNTLPILQTQQRLDQSPCSDHLRDQVNQADDQGAQASRRANPRGLKFAGQGIGKRVLTKPLERFGDNQQGHQPTGEVSDRIEKTVESIEGDHAADAQEGRRRKVVSSKRDPVDKPRYFAAGGKVPRARFGLGTQIETQSDGPEDHHQKDDDSKAA